jgi:endonuclease-3
MNEQERANRILEILKKNYLLPMWVRSKKEVFETLIQTVLSQATNDLNRDRAFKNLSEKFKITPKALAFADLREIESAIRVGGLFRSKSRKIRELSKVVVDRFDGSLGFLFSKPLNEARQLLMSFPGVGPKTADVVLLFSADKAVVPVDTHVNRVARRLGLAPLKGGYEVIRESLESLYLPKDYLAVHLLFISLGRTYCRARNPKHEGCPVNFLCPTMKSESGQPDLHRLHGSRGFL